jgi:hypothetical protein
LFNGINTRVTGGVEDGRTRLRGVPGMEIKVRLQNNEFEYVPGPHKLGFRTAFWDDLLADDSDQILGEHSGNGTLIRFEGGGEWFQYEATYRLSKNYADSRKSPPVLADDPTVDQDPTTNVKKGQITARGLVFFKGGDFVGSPRVAITGGTDEYKNARGQVTWTLATSPEERNKHTLDILL